MKQNIHYDIAQGQILKSDVGNNHCEWTLSTSQKNFMCHQCYNEVKPTFYVCSEHNFVYCSTCQYGPTLRCEKLSLSSEHVHYCIIRIIDSRIIQENDVETGGLIA